MNKKYVMLDLDDEKLNVLAEVLSNKTCKKILEYIAEKEASETEIARELNIPANTVNYNIKKLLETGLIERTKTYFWSVKGKKIPYYKAANKKIVISPKSSKNVVGVLSAMLLTGIAAFFVKIYSSNFISTGLSKTADNVDSIERVAEGADMAAPSLPQTTVNSVLNMPEIWIWFLLGGIFALIAFMILNWRKL